MHAVALTVSPTSVSEPAEQSAQPVVDTGLYLPAAHTVQDDAPASAPVSVSDPGEQMTQSAVETVLYCPPLQAVQLVAPPSLKVSVTEPAPHDAHEDCPVVV